MIVSSRYTYTRMTTTTTPCGGGGAHSV